MTNNEQGPLISSNQEALQQLADFLVAEIADIDQDGSGLAETIAADPNSNFAQWLAAMFDWIEQHNFSEGQLKEVVEDKGLVEVADDADAKDYLMMLKDNIFEPD